MQALKRFFLATFWLVTKINCIQNKNEVKKKYFEIKSKGFRIIKLFKNVQK